MILTVKNINMKKMRKIILAFSVFGVTLGFVGCKYDDSYLNPKLKKSLVYFASYQEYNRTLIVGEGLSFQIGAAIAGVTSNPQDQTVDFYIKQYVKKSPGDIRKQLPTSMFKINGSDYTIGSEIHSIIPKGKFLGYFTVNVDSAAFLGDASMVNGVASNLSNVYTLGTRIKRTSLDSIEAGFDSVFVTIHYQARMDGYYLMQQNVVRKEYPVGTYVDAKTITETYATEADSWAWRLLTRGPFKVEVASPTSSNIKGSVSSAQIKFNLNMGMDKVISYESIAGQPIVTPELTNTYDSKTRDFNLNFSYKKTGTPVNDTIYHVNAKLMFRNRIIDNINQTRDYLNYFNQ